MKHPCVRLLLLLWPYSFNVCCISCCCPALITAFSVAGSVPPPDKDPVLTAGWAATKGSAPEPAAVAGCVGDIPTSAWLPEPSMPPIVTPNPSGPLITPSLLRTCTGAPFNGLLCSAWLVRNPPPAAAAGLQPSRDLNDTASVRPSAASAMLSQLPPWQLLGSRVLKWSGCDLLQLYTPPGRQ